MNARNQILIVAQTSALANKLHLWLGAEGYWVTAVSTFAAAKLHLELQPMLVITELKLGEYNGLHLAIRANANRIPALIIGERDRFFEAEAEQAGAGYFGVDEITGEKIISYVESHVRFAREHELDDAHLAWIDQGSGVRIQGDGGPETGISLPLVNPAVRRERVN
jgi:DNA-binding response OmpR family regulator